MRVRTAELAFSHALSRRPPAMATAVPSSTTPADAAATTRVFAQLKPVVLALLLQLRDLSASPTGGGGVSRNGLLAPLQSLLSLLPALEPGGLPRCIDYVLIPLRVTLQSLELDETGLYTRHTELVWQCIAALADAVGGVPFCSDRGGGAIADLQIRAMRVLERGTLGAHADAAASADRGTVRPPPPSEELRSAVTRVLAVTAEAAGGLSLRLGAPAADGAGFQPVRLWVTTTPPLTAAPLGDSGDGGGGDAESHTASSSPFSNLGFAGQTVACLLGALDASAAAGPTRSGSPSLHGDTLRALCGVMGALGRAPSSHRQLPTFLPGIATALCNWLLSRQPVHSHSQTRGLQATSSLLRPGSSSVTSFTSASGDGDGGMAALRAAPRPSRRLTAGVLLALAELFKLSLGSTLQGVATGGGVGHTRPAASTTVAAPAARDAGATAPASTVPAAASSGSVSSNNSDVSGVDGVLPHRCCRPSWHAWFPAG